MKLRSTTALTSLALLALTACGGSEAPTFDSSSSSASESAAAETTSAAAAETTAAAESSTASASASASTPASASASSTAVAADPSSACGQPASSNKTIEGTIAVDEWVKRGNGEYPTSAKFGGLEKGENGSPVCFSHSPEGAVLALATIWGSPYDPDELRASFKDRATPSALADTFVDSYVDGMKQTAGDDVDKLLEMISTQTVAYNLQSYDGDYAKVQLAEALNGEESGYMKFTFTMQWRDNDWYLDMSKLEDASTAIAQVDTLDGMTKFQR